MTDCGTPASGELGRPRAHGRWASRGRRPRRTATLLMTTPASSRGTLVCLATAFTEKPRRRGSMSSLWDWVPTLSCYRKVSAGDTPREVVGCGAPSQAHANGFGSAPTSARPEPSLGTSSTDMSGIASSSYGGRIGWLYPGHGVEVTERCAAVSLLRLRDQRITTFVNSHGTHESCTRRARQIDEAFGYGASRRCCDVGRDCNAVACSGWRSSNPAMDEAD